MKFPRGAKIFVGQFDPLPYVGVFLCLLIFFLFFQSMILPGGMVVELPRSQTPAHVGPMPWKVVLDRRGNYYYENRIWEGPELLDYFRDRIVTLDGRPSLMLQADRNVTLDQLSEAFSYFQQAGFEKIFWASHTPVPGFGANGNAPEPQ